MKLSKELEAKLLALAGTEAPAARGNKYHAQADEHAVRVIDGERVQFHSRKEAKRWDHLQLLWLGGHISRPHRQVWWPLVVNGIKVGSYVADFCYVVWGTGDLVVEDAKGFRTPAYKLKARLFRACHGFSILEV